MKLNITQKGKELMLRCIDMAGDGEVLTFTQLVLGNGTHTDVTEESLQNPLLYLGINTFERSETSVELTSVFDNSAVSDRFRITEMGVLAKDPEDMDATILFAYGYVPEDEASVVPAVTDLIFETSITVSVYVGTLDNIEVSLEGKLQSASKEDLEAHTNDRDNPHKVTARAVGLGNVENVSFGDHTPVYDISEDLKEAEPGEKFKILLGKLGKGLKDLIAHIVNTKNPHKVTASQVNAASKDHKHSTGDITSGILSVARGGTGVDSMSKLCSEIHKLGLPLVQTITYTGAGNRYVSEDAAKKFYFSKGAPAFVILASVESGVSRRLALIVRGAEAFPCITTGTSTMAGLSSWEDELDSQGNIIGCTLRIWNEAALEGASYFDAVGIKYTCIGIG